MSSGSRASIVTLKQFAGRRVAGERCEICGRRLGTAHRHLMESSSRRLVCSCDPCSLLFGHEEDQRYRTIPRKVFALADFQLSPAQWDSLRIPIQLAYFTRSSVEPATTAHFPGPGGPIADVLDEDVWQMLEAENPRLRAMMPEVEALLLNRMRDANEAYLVPIDRAFRLSGLIRLHWRGLSGGVTVWQEILGFFDELRSGRLRA